MIGNEYIYGFKKKSTGQFYGVDANYQLVISSNPYFLKFNPDGWKDISVQNKRNRKYFGLDRSFTIPLGFVEDGAAILKNVYYKQGVEADIVLVICEQRLFIDPTEYGFWYKQLYTGEVDLTTWLHNGPRVNVTILEEGITKYIKANENTTYELPLNVPEAIEIKNDGIALIQKAQYYISNGAVADDRGGHTLSCALVTAESINAVSAVTQNRIETSNNVAVLWPLDEKIITTGAQPEEMTFTWDFEMTPSLVGVGAIFATTIFFQLRVLSNSTTDTNHNVDSRGGGDPLLLYNIKHHFQGTTTFTVPANSRVVPFMIANQNDDFTLYSYEEDGSLIADYKYRYQQTITRALRPGYVFSKLIELATEGQFTIDAAGLLTNEQTKVFSSGDGVRGFEEAVIKISISDFHGFWDTYKDAGIILTPAGKVKMDRKIDLIDKTSVIDLGEIAELKVSSAKEFLFNNLKIGYPDKQQEDLNGRESFNNTFEWSAGALRESKELNKVSKVITDCYSAEITRLRFGQRATTDSKQDSGIYCFHIEATPQVDGTYLFDRSINATALGLIEKDSVYNIELSPKRCLINNGSYIKSCFDLMESKYLTFQTSSKNNKLQAGNPLIAERENVLISTLDAKYFKPIWFEFETQGDLDLLDHLNINPLSVFKFTFKGAEYFGLPESVGIEPSSRKKQVYKLLCMPETDIKNLIDYYG